MINILKRFSFQYIDQSFLLNEMLRLIEKIAELVKDKKIEGWQGFMKRL